VGWGAVTTVLAVGLASGGPGSCTCAHGSCLLFSTLRCLPAACLPACPLCRAKVAGLATVDGGLVLQSIHAAADGTRKMVFKLANGPAAGGQVGQRVGGALAELPVAGSALAWLAVGRSSCPNANSTACPALAWKGTSIHFSGHRS
jgi:hypothetical protein